MNIIDLTFDIDNNCMTCGTPWHINVQIQQLGKISEVGRNTHGITLGSHTGTHIDAPLHFFNGADGINQIDLAQVCGDVSVVNFSYIKQGQFVTLNDVTRLTVSSRMIFRFDWFKKWKTSDYYKQFPYFSMDAIQYLVEKGLRVIALDTPSPDEGSAISLKDDSPIHKFLMTNKVVIMEYLTNTDKLAHEKQYQLFALPLKIKNCDGAPARIIAIEKE